MEPQNRAQTLSGSRSECRAISGNPNPRRRAGRIRTAAARLTQSVRLSLFPSVTQPPAPAADKAREDLRRMVGKGPTSLIKDFVDQQLRGPVRN